MKTWKDVAAVADFDASDRKYIEVDEDLQIGIFRLEDGSLQAIEIWCTHQKISLITGDVEGCEIMCPMHGARFDLRTGQHLSLPAVRALKHFALRQTAEGRIEVNV